MAAPPAHGPLRASRCRDCKVVTMLWAWTTNGRRVGLDPEPITDAGTAKFVLIDRGDFTLALTVRDFEMRRQAIAAGVPMFTAHRDVCRDAPARPDDWRDR